MTPFWPPRSAKSASAEVKRTQFTCFTSTKVQILTPFWPLRSAKSASAEAKRRDMQHFFLANAKSDAEGEKGFSTKESMNGKDRLQV